MFLNYYFGFNCIDYIMEDLNHELKKTRNTNKMLQYLMYRCLLVIRGICSIMLQSLLLNEVKLTMPADMYV